MHTYMYIHTHIHKQTNFITLKTTQDTSDIMFYVALHSYLLRGLNCALRTGEGKRNLYSHSPDSTSHKHTFQSVEELSNFLLLLLQLE